MKAIRRSIGDEQGLTLTEILIVFLIVGLLLLIAIPTFLNQEKKTEGAAAKVELAAAYRSGNAVFKSNNDKLPDQTTLVNKVQADQPELTIIEGTVASKGQIALHRDSDNAFSLTTVADNGDIYGWSATLGANPKNERWMISGASEIRNLVKYPNFEETFSSNNGLAALGCPAGNYLDPLATSGTKAARNTCPVGGGTAGTGIQYGRDTNNEYLLTVVPGTTYLASMDYLDNSEGQKANMSIRWYNASKSALPSNTWAVGDYVSAGNRAHAIGTAPPGSTYALLILQAQNKGAPNETMKSDSLLFVEAAHPNIDYFDGDSPNAQWEGEQNKSTSKKSLMKPW